MGYGQDGFYAIFEDFYIDPVIAFAVKADFTRGRGCQIGGSASARLSMTGRSAVISREPSGSLLTC